MTKLSLDALPDAGADLTDRERLALAFGILREQGWFAPIDWSVTTCCVGHGWSAVHERIGVTHEEWDEIEFDDEPATVWWTTQADSLAFYGTATEAVMSPEMEARVDAVYAEFGEDEDAVEQWMIEHADELDADEMIERTTKLVNLVDLLSLNWSGGMAKMNEAVAVLRSVGLIVTEPPTPNQRITVHAAHTPMQVKVRIPDNRIAVWFDTAARIDSDMPHAVLTREDAEGLIEMLRMALDADPQT